MKTTPSVPYITMSDLNEVLYQCEDAGYITGAARHRIMETAEDRTAELIRKSADQIAANLLRDDCRRLANSIYRETKVALSRERKKAHVDYEAKKKEAYLNYEVRLAEVRKGHEELKGQAIQEIAELKIKLAPMTGDTEERKQTVEAIKKIETRLRELKRDKEYYIEGEAGQYGIECSMIKADYHRRLCDLSVMERQSLDDREMDLNKIRDLKPEQLATFRDRLQADLLEVSGVK